MQTEEHFGKFASRKIITCQEEVPGQFVCEKFMETFFGVRAERFLPGLLKSISACWYI